MPLSCVKYLAHTKIYSWEFEKVYWTTGLDIKYEDDEPFRIKQRFTIHVYQRGRVNVNRRDNLYDIA